ncbi:phosphatidate cytidylyltransferase [Phenylobacterium sp.]|jgi:phosphatidate cytidylyltransferase|uniref:phosphatidate cytidylyltransferase n=1 Tax=Phenylobacterium sp. TaxID=1871053 RepID=UPI002E354327|nr:phosphatidate cytidylyltransferase [Phenylobacterium sp.]HEX2561602.1 phosphatidate cytidylyltransferase [Phenylobacterium sp.]
MIEAISDFWMNRPPALLWGLAGVFTALTLGAIMAAILPRLRPGGDYRNLQLRVNSWWAMAALLSGALLGGWPAMTALFALVSFLALKEFLSLAPTPREDRLLILAAYLTIPVSYAFVAADIYMFYLVFVPVYVFMAVPTAMAMIGQTHDYLPRASVFHFAVVTCVYNLGYVALLMRVPDWEAPQAGPAGLVFMLLLATEGNDVAQYVTGKLFGRRKILPKVSPNKTWEGFLGGWILTAALIVLVGPKLTPFEGVGLWTLAITLPLAGFAGDVTMSAVKRDIGVKDTSAFIPGHGGVLDRADSLVFTAPLFFHLLALFHVQTY